MSIIDEEGFLAAEIDRVVADCESRQPELCKLYRALNRRARTLIVAQEVTRDLQPILCALYFGRILSVYEAVFLLGTRGMENETAMLMRGLIEAHFKFHYCAASLENCRVLVADEHERLRQLKNVQRHPPSDQTAEQAAALQKLIGEVEHELRANNVQKLTTKEIAAQLGRQWEYDLKYAHFCDPLHSGPRSFQESMRMNSRGTVDGLFLGPRHIEIPFKFAGAMDVLVEAMVHPVLAYPISADETRDWRQRVRTVFEALKS